MARRAGLSALSVGLCLLLTGSAYPLSQQEEAKGDLWWVWVLIALVLLAFAAYVIWWWFGSREERDTAVPQRAADVEMPGPAISDAPATVDDLKIIEGIGPKIAGVLGAAGIISFRQLADTEPARILRILEDADPRLIRLADPATWPQQARLAAEGDWDGLRQLQDQLKAGRKI